MGRERETAEKRRGETREGGTRGKEREGGRLSRSSSSSSFDEGSRSAPLSRFRRRCDKALTGSGLRYGIGFRGGGAITSADRHLAGRHRKFPELSDYIPFLSLLKVSITLLLLFTWAISVTYYLSRFYFRNYLLLGFHLPLRPSQFLLNVGNMLGICLERIGNTFLI